MFAFNPYTIIIPVAIVVVLILITATVKILRQYERAVVFTLGRFQKVKGPGLVSASAFSAGRTITPD